MINGENYTSAYVCLAIRFEVLLSWSLLPVEISASGTCCWSWCPTVASWTMRCYTCLCVV